MEGGCMMEDTTEDVFKSFHMRKYKQSRSLLYTPELHPERNSSKEADSAKMGTVGSQKSLNMPRSRTSSLRCRDDQMPHFKEVWFELP